MNNARHPNSFGGRNMNNGGGELLRRKQDLRKYSLPSQNSPFTLQPEQPQPEQIQRNVFNIFKWFSK